MHGGEEVQAQLAAEEEIYEDTYQGYWQVVQRLQVQKEEVTEINALGLIMLGVLVAIIVTVLWLVRS